MLFVQGKRYLFMTQRYAFRGTVEHVTPTHVVLGEDACVMYEDVGGFEEWASGGIKRSNIEGKVPGQVICTLGTDATPIP